MPSLHVLACALALLTYVLTTRAHRERRPPAVAIAWVLGMVTLPYLFLPLYFLFGRRKFQRVQRRPLAAPAPRHWASDQLACFGIAPPGPADARFHADGQIARDRLFALVDSARHSLDICTFLVGDDAFSRQLAAKLAARVRAGVAVRLLVDGAGSLLGSRRVLTALRNSGVVVGVFRPPLRWHARGPRNLRNHRKWAIADGRTLFSGGRNLAGEYFTGLPGELPWLDLSFDLDGPPVQAAALQFELDWQSARIDGPIIATVGGPPAGIDNPGAAPMSALDTDANCSGSAQFVASGPDQSEDTLQAVLVAGAYHARTRILAVTPYFVPDDALKNALRLAALRGVAVTLVLPVRSNHRLADLARGRALRELAEAGVQIRLVEQMVHAKAVVIDDALALTGSVNLDTRSLLLNHEAAVLFYGAAQVHWIADWIDTLAAGATAHVPTPAGFWRDLGEGLLLSVAFQL